MILFCLSDAFRGTIYSIGPIPDLRTIRIASGRRNGQTDEIIWGVANPSDYDYPGRVWDAYRDRPGGILEAMAWCVERQKSWTAEDPENNIRCVRKQLEGKASEDYHHMEPVLVRKDDLWDKVPPPDMFPKNGSGEPMWEDSSYATVAVIKIHFLPGTIKQGDKSTRLIKELSRSLGTEMLSLHARELLLEKEKKLAQERQDTCNVLAHEFRNLVPKIGFAYRAINNEISYLREAWEDLLCQHNSDQKGKKIILQQLNDILKGLQEDLISAGINKETFSLIHNQEYLMTSCLLPQQNEIWLRRQIRPLWRSILSKTNSEPSITTKVEKLLSHLDKSFHNVNDKDSARFSLSRDKWRE
jgi:hypothetical protein